jgi:hypothetical protein
MRRSVRLAIPVAALVALCAGAGAVAAGVIGGIPPGHTMRAQQFASGGIGDANGDFIQIGLQTGTVSFRTRGGAVLTEDTSVVTAQAFTPDGIFGFGCWTVPSSMIDFNIQSHVTVRFDSSAPGVTGCPGIPLASAVAAGPAPTLADSSTFGLVGRVAINATWTSGSLDYNTQTINTTCGDFTAIDQQVTRAFSAGPAMTITEMTLEGTNPTTGLTEDVSLAGASAVGPAFGNVSDITENFVVNGPATGSCGQFGS